MAYTQFPAVQNVRVIETNEEFFLGGFNPNFNGEIPHIRIHLYVKGTAGGSETLQAKIYTIESTSASVFKSSDVVNLSSFATADKLGVVRFDFTKLKVSSGRQYYLSLAAASYTRNASTFYLATLYDYPNEINTTNSFSDALNRCNKFEIFYKN